MDKYFRSQMIPNDPGTMCYWAEDKSGRSRDVLPDSIPEGALVNDLTDKPKWVRKRNGSFESYSVANGALR